MIPDSPWPVDTITVELTYTFDNRDIDGVGDVDSVVISNTFTRVRGAARGIDGLCVRVGLGDYGLAPLTFMLVADQQNIWGAGCQCCPCAAGLIAVMGEPTLVGTRETYDGDPPVLTDTVDLYGRVSSMALATSRCKESQTELGFGASVHTYDPVDALLDVTITTVEAGEEEICAVQTVAFSGTGTFFYGHAAFTWLAPNGYTITFQIVRGSSGEPFDARDYIISMGYDDSLPANTGLPGPPDTIFDGIRMTILGDGFRLQFTGQYGFQAINEIEELSNDFAGFDLIPADPSHFDVTWEFGPIAGPDSVISDTHTPSGDCPKDFSYTASTTPPNTTQDIVVTWA